MKREELITRLRILTENVEHPETLGYGPGDIADELEQLMIYVNAAYEAGEELSK